MLAIFERWPIRPTTWELESGLRYANKNSQFLNLGRHSAAVTELEPVSSVWNCQQNVALRRQFSLRLRRIPGRQEYLDYAAGSTARTTHEYSTSRAIKAVKRLFDFLGFVGGFSRRTLLLYVSKPPIVVFDSNSTAYGCQK